VDPERGVECADGRIGEVWIHGPSVAQGYWQNPEATQQTFGATLPGDERRYVQSGDLGFVRAESCSSPVGGRPLDRRV
jgi:acyl-CoA synthetase (AMP-forming)/AMP-acid ligase II